MTQHNRHPPPGDALASKRQDNTTIDFSSTPTLQHDHRITDLLDYLQHRFSAYPFNRKLDTAFILELAADFERVNLLEQTNLSAGTTTMIFLVSATHELRYDDGWLGLRIVLREQPPSQCVPCLFGALPRMSLALPVQPAHELDARPATPRWLIEGLWADEAVGIVGGEPKSFKSFLVLDMAVAVASGSPCLRHFPVAHTGRVLLYAAEDALQVVRRRLEGICHLTHLNLAQLDIQVITAPSLRLDTLEDQKRLRFTIEQLRPRLLLLDPFVRLHRIDENASSDVAAILAYFRELQRLFHLAVVVVHHARKAANHLRAGQALRGSSEFHAWGDSNLYIKRKADHLTLTIEHRAAAEQNDLPLTLQGANDQLALCMLENRPPPKPPRSPAHEQILDALATAESPLVFSVLRQACRMRTQIFCSVLAEMQQQGKVVKTPNGYQLVSAAAGVSLSRSL